PHVASSSVQTMSIRLERFVDFKHLMLWSFFHCLRFNSLKGIFLQSYAMGSRIHGRIRAVVEPTFRGGTGIGNGVGGIAGAVRAAAPLPHSSGIERSKHRHMRELRIQHEGRPYRALYAFDPRRVAILLIGGDKTGNDRWYEQFVPLADRLYDA